MTCAANRTRRLAVVLAGLLGGTAVPASAMTLGDAYQRAVQHDPAIASSLAQYEADLEASTLERATLRPVVSASGKYDFVHNETKSQFFPPAEGDYEAWSAALTARQPLFRLDWFARGDRADALDALTDISVVDRRQKLLLRVAERYFGVLNAQDAVSQAGAEAKAVRESLEDTRKRYEVELVPGTDLKEAQARDDLAQARLLSARRSLENARDALDEVTGNGRVDLPQIREDTVFPPLQPAQVDDWVKTARDHNPAILQAKQNLVIAGADRRSRVSEAAPSLDLVGRIARNDDSDYDLGQRLDDARVGVELTVPLYAGGAVSAAKRQAAAQERFASAELNRTTLETERQTRQLFNQVQTAYAETEAYHKALISAQAAEKATRAGYEAGTRTITDVLDAQSRTVQARLNYDSTRYSLLLNLLQLKQIAGSLTERDFASIDQLLTPQ
jgi:outer membrane protein